MSAALFVSGPGAHDKGGSVEGGSLVMGGSVVEEKLSVKGGLPV